MLRANTAPEANPPHSPQVSRGDRFFTGQLVQILAESVAENSRVVFQQGGMIGILAMCWTCGYAPLRGLRVAAKRWWWHDSIGITELAP